MKKPVRGENSNLVDQYRTNCNRNRDDNVSCEQGIWVHLQCFDLSRHFVQAVRSWLLGLSSLVLPKWQNKRRRIWPMTTTALWEKVRNLILSSWLTTRWDCQLGLEASFDTLSHWTYLLRQPECLVLMSMERLGLAFNTIYTDGSQSWIPTNVLIADSNVTTSL